MADREISAFFLQGAIRVCELDGLPVKTILDAGGTDVETIRLPGARILRSQAVAIIGALADASPDPQAAFRAGLCAPIDRSKELVHLFSTASDLKSLVGPLNAALSGICGGFVRLSVGSAYARLGLGFPSWNIPIEEPFMETAAGALVGALRLRFGPRWKPIRLLVGHLLPVPKLVEYEGIEIALGAPDNAAVLTVSDASSKPPGLSTVHANGDSDAKPAIYSNTVTVDQIRQVIFGRLSLSRDTGIDDVARVFQLSSRTMTRSLAAAGQTYRALVEDVKQTEARRLLAETQIPVTEIAGILRYSHLPSFSRAFARSAGCSPSQFRKSVHSTPGTVHGRTPA